MTSKVPLFLVPLLGVLITAPATAGGAGPSAITATTGYPGSSNVFFFSTNGTRTSPPACATVVNRWVVNASTDTGKATIALILSAQAQGKTVYVYGTGNCAIWADSESVNFVDFIS